MRKVLELNGIDAVKTAAYYMYREDVDKGATNEDYMVVVQDYIQQAKDYICENHQFPIFENEDYPIVTIVNDIRSRYFPVMIYRVEHEDEIIIDEESELPEDEEWAIIDIEIGK